MKKKITIDKGERVFFQSAIMIMEKRELNVENPI